MASLAEKLTASEVRSKVVASCVDLVEQEVADKTGLSGVAIKTGYKVVKAIKPGMVPSVINTLLPEFADALEPMFGQASGECEAFVRALKAEPGDAAEALLTVTDVRAQRAQNGAVTKVYARLRSSAKDNVSAAVPRLADTLRPYL